MVIAKSLRSLLLLPVAVLSLLLCSAVTHAQDVGFATSFTEPTTNKNGSNLDDLSHHSITITDGSGNVLAESASITASSATGGQPIQEQLSFVAPADASTPVVITARSFDTSGNASDPVSINKVVDTLAPGSPQGITVTITITVAPQP